MKAQLEGYDSAVVRVNDPVALTARSQASYGVGLWEFFDRR